MSVRVVRFLDTCTLCSVPRRSGRLLLLHSSLFKYGRICLGPPSPQTTYIGTQPQEERNYPNCTPDSLPFSTFRYRIHCLLDAFFWSFLILVLQKTHPRTFEGVRYDVINFPLKLTGSVGSLLRPTCFHPNSISLLQLPYYVAFHSGQCIQIGKWVWSESWVVPV